MTRAKYNSRPGLTIIELVVASAISLILISAVGILLIGNTRAWEKTYRSAHSRAKQDAMAVTVAFGAIGRQSNRLDYTIYTIDSGKFTPAMPKTSDTEEVVSGDAVEFRYWDEDLDKTDSADLLDVTKTATAYALFYIQGDELRVDNGPYPPGAVPTGSGPRNTSGVKTRVLARNVSINKETKAGAFSHTTVSGAGQGSVRINIVLADENSGEPIRVMTATLMRNIWPR